MLSIDAQQRAAVYAALMLHEVSMTQPTDTLTLSTGVTVGIRKVSPYTFDAINRAYPPPLPPLVKNDFGNGDVREEPNPADPDYQAALAEHEALKSRHLQDVMLRLGVVVEVDAAALEALRATMDTIGVPLDKDEHLAYVKHLAIGSKEDLTALIAAITGASQPTEEAVTAAAATFPGNVSGA